MVFTVFMEILLFPFMFEFYRSSLVYDIHNFLPGLLGYLILFATRAFVPQRQFIHRRLLSPLPVTP